MAMAARKTQILEVTYDLEISAVSAWEVLGTFENFLEWATGGTGSIEIEGEGVGMIRHLEIPGGGKQAERLDQLNHAMKKISYSLVYGNPLGMEKYAATAELSSRTANACSIHWRGEFIVQDGTDENSVRSALKAAYDNMSTAIESYVARTPLPSKH
tara:strand:- start:1705 stop:2175 length:471 start_codon:yes stop_codon:yes gene_type:complete